MMEWALRYIRLGWPVIPLRGKIPLTVNGSKDFSLNENQLRAWWARWPDANVGLATGHGWFAIDVDTKKGGDETWETLRMQHAGAPDDTIEQTTGTGGRHILYLTPADYTVKNSQRNLGPGVDVRGQGGYIVATPSIHPTRSAGVNGTAYWKSSSRELCRHRPGWFACCAKASVVQAVMRRPSRYRKIWKADAMIRCSASPRDSGVSSEAATARG
jgi:hypothetical protein